MEDNVTEWKIITVSKYDLENFRQYVVADHIKHKQLGMKMLEALQADVKDSDSTWYQIVPQKHRLWLGMEEFVDNTCEGCGADLYGKLCCLTGYWLR